MIHENETMTAKEVADYLRLTEATVYKLAQSGEIPAAKVGRIWRFKRGLIDEWFRRRSDVFVASVSESRNFPRADRAGLYTTVP